MDDDQNWLTLIKTCVINDDDVMLPWQHQKLHMRKATWWWIRETARTRGASGKIFLALTGALCVMIGPRGHLSFYSAPRHKSTSDHWNMFNSTKCKLGQARNSHNKQTKAPLTQLHDADLYIICWIIVNVFRARMCAWYLPKGMKQEVLSNALPREQGVYWIIWSLIISLKNIPVA